jgi:DnaK suppressor protein
MTVQEYKQRLLDLEKRLSRHISDEREQAREQVLDSPRDAADDSVADEDESVDFAVAELDTTALEQIRDALQRIEDGTFGRCVVDGEPIEPKRLEALPWKPYCLKHQNELATVSATHIVSGRTTASSVTERERLLGAFIAAAHDGDVAGLEDLFASDVVSSSDAFVHAA